MNESEPTTWKDLRQKEREKFRDVTQEEAKTRLENMGYSTDTWDKLLTSGNRDLGSHDIRLLILIAQGVNIFEG